MGLPYVNYVLMVWKRKIVSALLLFVLSPILILSQSVITTTGGEGTGTGGTTSFTVGQIAYEYNNSGGSMSAGVQQPFVLSGLPIQLLYFDAELQPDNTVLLSWDTETEINNDYFTIERSIDGWDWETLLDIPGAGTTSLPQSYQSIDENPHEGLSYYRLKQTDFDGRFTYSPIRTIRISEYHIIIYPNPTRDVLTLDVSTLSDGDVQYQILDARGIVVIQSRTTEKQTPIDIAQLASGIYWIRIQTLDQPSTIYSFIKIN